MARAIEAELKRVHQRLRACRKCPNMCGTAVHGGPVASPILLVGQAPGVHEGPRGKPFAYTAGKTLFKWFGEVTGADEDELRERIYFSAVARCFPGKATKGDRVPSKIEVANCREYLSEEVRVLEPKLILAVGRLAIAETLGPVLFGNGVPLETVVGRVIPATFHGWRADVLPLPHPSGVSRWPVTEPGRTCLKRALKQFGARYRELMA